MSLIPAGSLDQAAAAHAAGDHGLAEAICVARLRDGRACARTLSLLGRLRGQAGRHDEAAMLLGLALQGDPALPHGRHAWAEALAAAGRHEQALAVWQHTPAGIEDPQAGIVDPAAGIQHAPAIQDPAPGIADLPPGIEDSLSIEDPAALLGAAASYRALRRWAEAEALYRRVLALRPASVAALFGRGLALAQLRRHPEALACLTAACAGDPQRADAHLALGRTLAEVGRPAAALGPLTRALDLDGGNADAACAVGAALARLGRHADALPWLERALRLAPGMADAYREMGNALSMLRVDEAALACVREARRLAPENPEHAADEAGMLLRAGRLVAGFRAYEQREFAVTLSRLAPPAWDGAERIDGQAILLIAEQGLGDTLQFIRYAPLVAALGARVTVEVQPPLAALLGACAPALGVDIIARGAARPVCQWQCALLSLPHVLRTRLDTIPAATPYLHAPCDRQAAWDARLSGWPGPRKRRVGFCASGNPRYRRDAQRSAGLAAFAPLFALPGIEWVLLQPEPRPAEAAVLAGSTDIRQPGADIADFADTAALIARLDLVISVDTAVAHLAGALNLPVWILLPYVADWRWLQDREDTPWYPSARLFRQDDRRDWSVPVARIAADLLG